MESSVTIITIIFGVFGAFDKKGCESRFNTLNLCYRTNTDELDGAIA